LDLNSIAKPDRTFSLTLLDPASFLPLTADSGEEMTIVLRSQDSKEYQAEKRKQQNQTMKAAKFTRKLPEAETVEQRGRVLLASCVVSWFGVQLRGAVLPNPPALADVLAVLEIGFVYEQVDAAVHDRGNFVGE
jgi:hypothetical protein